MKSKNIKYLLLSTVIIASIFCFASINLTSSSETPIVNIEASVQSVEVKQSKLPDLKLIKSIVEIVGKFTTAH